MIACPDCGQLHRYQPLVKRQQACCSRCQSILYRHRPHFIQKHIALNLAAIILLMMTHAFPLLALSAQGLVQELTLLKSVQAFWESDWYSLAAIASLNILILPVVEIGILMWVFLSLQWQWSANVAIALFRWFFRMKPWIMLEVFMLGTIVALVKLGDVANLVIGVSFWAFCALIVVMTVDKALLDASTVWHELGKLKQAQMNER